MEHLRAAAFRPASGPGVLGLGRLWLVAVEQLGKQVAELSLFGGVEACEQVGLDGIGVPLEFSEVLPSGRGEGDDVAAPVGEVGSTVDLAAGLQAVDDAADVVAVKAEAAADVGLAEPPYSSSAARTAKSARALSGMRRAVSRAPSVDTLFACQLASSRGRAGGCNP